MYQKIIISRIGNRYYAEGFLRNDSPLPERGAYGNTPKEAYKRLLSNTRFWCVFRQKNPL